jgi:hypothetical protein
MTEFNRGIDALRKSVGATSRAIIEKESGELIKTLVRISPPNTEKDPNAKRKIEQSIQDRVNNNFERLGRDTNFATDSGKVSKTGVKWYAASSKYLFGATADKDMRKSSYDELLAVHYRAREIQHSTRILTNFTSRKTRQRVAITSKILAKKSAISSLIKRLQKHVGRLKAGWLVAVVQGKIRVTGGKLPPLWVTRHASGARGRFEDGLSSPDYPTFTISNFAKGIRSEASLYFAREAVKIRAAAMLKNAELHLIGKKNLSDYNKGVSVLKL